MRFTCKRISTLTDETYISTRRLKRGVIEEIEKEITYKKSIQTRNPQEHKELTEFRSSCTFSK